MIKPTSQSTLAQWLDYLGQLHSSSIDLGLARMQPLAEKFGVTQFTHPVITVAGTNGKGSTVATLESVYLQSGYQTAALTSPHLLHFTERLRINGQDVDDNAFVAAFCQIELARETTLSFFEFTVLAELLIIQQANVDVAILEIGLGGRLDAVNIVEPDVSIVTSVGMDHQDWLGNSRESIGYAKAGIYRAHKPAICGDPAPPESVVNYAHEIAADYLPLSPSEVQQCLTELRVNFSDLHVLPSNAVCAVQAVRCMQGRLPVPDTALRAGLLATKVIGRQQIWQRNPLVILDVAHNPTSAIALAEFLTKLKLEPGCVQMVLAMLPDKDVASVVAPLIPFAAHWHLAGLKVPGRSQLGIELEAKLCDHANVARTVYDEVSDAYTAAKQTAGHKGCVLVFGSFHTIAAVMKKEKI